MKNIRKSAVSLLLAVAVFMTLLPFGFTALATGPTYTVLAVTGNPAHGEAGVNTAVAEAGAAIILTAIPRSGYRFVRWDLAEGGEDISFEVTYDYTLEVLDVRQTAFVMPAYNVTVVAVFEAVPDAGASGGGVDPTIRDASEWAWEGIIRGISLNLVPQQLRSNYRANITRAEFCGLVVALYEAVQGREITGRVTFDDTNDVNVQKAAAAGIVLGVGPGSFDPDGTLTREQAATMLARLVAEADKALLPQPSSFADTGSISGWALDSVGRIQYAGIMQGVGGGMFAPKNLYTREQSILTILRVYDYLRK